MRASVLVLGPLVARHGSARVALPGGCAIGVRPIDQHLKGLARLGADIAIENGYVVARARRLRGARITTDLVTVTGTENLMMAAVLADGTTIIENAAREPQVAHLAAVLAKLDECGVDLDVGPAWVRVRGPARPGAADVTTSPFPGFPTDMQAQLMTLLGLADGQSRVTETIFENRFMHAAELVRLGARIETEGSTAAIRGVRHYQGAQVMASDLRASASLVLAGLAGHGPTAVGPGF